MLGTARLTGQTIGAVMLAAIYGLWDLPDGQGETIAMCGGGVCVAGGGEQFVAGGALRG